jgi:transcriptional regulator with XRE-family HTH domain
MWMIVRKKKQSLRQLAKELGVSHSYLSQVKHGKRPPSKKVVSKMISNSGFNRGGSVWGSNPPKTLCMPPDGFEVREAHRDLDAPLKISTTYCTRGGDFAPCQPG